MIHPDNKHPTSDNQPISAVDLQLLAVLKQMVADLGDQHNRYMVSANYFEFLDETRKHPRRYLAPIYFHQDSVWNVDLDQQGILLDVLLQPDKRTPRERIRIPYDQIYRVEKNQTGGMFIGDNVVYDQGSKLKMPPIT